MPIIKVKIPTSIEASKTSFNSTKPAIEIAGIPSKKVNLAASSRFHPFSIELVKVTPERETPGKRANICPKPITKPSLPEIDSNDFD